jgi:hypothetical protein
MRRVFLALVLVAATATSTVVAEGKKCCFTNPSYSGACEVKPAKDESCQGILAYLNNPNSVGKSYCASTNVRGGWALTACKSAPKKQD